MSFNSSTSAGHGSNGQQAPGIVHFDATTRRKDKMRNKSEGAPAALAPAPVRAAAPAPAAVAAPVKAVAPVAAPPVVKAPAPVKAVAPVAPVAVAPAPAPAAKPSGKALNPAELEKFLVNFVVEQTGYPEEMVELDADLEADLGIDSIKKAQLFGELAEHLNIQVTISEDMSLDDFPTLRHVMDFLAKSAQGAPA